MTTLNPDSIKQEHRDMLDSLRAGLIIDAARSLIGTPYHDLARVPGHGLDCIGVPVLAAQIAGALLVDKAVYTTYPDGSLEKEFDARAERISAEEPGCLVAYRFLDTAHCGILTGEGTIIHAINRGKSLKASQGEVSEHRIPAGWSDKVTGYWRIRWQA